MKAGTGIGNSPIEIIYVLQHSIIEKKRKDYDIVNLKKVLDQIFQPFFTTKPTWQGTGLGFSLAYDIVKAHGSELKVETTEGESAEFIIQLPVT